jgi:PST family polysaccharide transporter
MSYVLVAKGKQALFFGSEVIWAIASLGLAWFGIRWWGLNGVGMAFAGSYLVYGVLLLFIVGGISGFTWSEANRKTGLLYLCLISLVFAGFTLLPSFPAICLGVVMALLCLVYSIRRLVKLVSARRIPAQIRRLLERMNLISTSAEQAE